ncbi:hypothetical protein LOAG_14372 [Loa loa]|uniref:Uncharacterized protein n=1 Tax=Loa loa TaxID=7209 RepID=A0A1S0THV5_LOALO|nr:hypothetical protein LOAG_14372 [Loa loa]EFO14152.2 hypothetical protein LOAG_14372 [Loa loa]
MIIDRFWAELFRLSSDRTQWNILYPSLLSITVAEMLSRKHDVNCKTIRLLVKNESGIVKEQILDAYLINKNREAINEFDNKP